MSRPLDDRVWYIAPFSAMETSTAGYIVIDRYGDVVCRMGSGVGTAVGKRAEREAELARSIARLLTEEANR